MIAYFDCFSGISGDMTIGAFISLGVPIKYIEKNIADMFKVSLVSKEVLKNGIRANSFFVQALGRKKNLNYAEIKGIISESDLNKKVKKLSFDMFEKIADAESYIHRTPKGKLHFHEIGSIDTIVDIVGTSLCVDYLKIKKVFSSKIPFSKGFIFSSHGKLPIPAPATLEILKNCPMQNIDIEEELVTPTGATIIKTLATKFNEFPNMEIKKIGYGAGTKDIKEMPNVLRIILGKENKNIRDNILIIETNIDDMSSEILGFLMEKLFKEGALDVCFIPIYMKKNRPAIKIEVLCPIDKKSILIKTILSETSSIGVRYYEVKRKVLERKSVILKTKFGNMKAKEINRPNGKTEIVPEYEECKRIAKKNNISLRSVYAQFTLY